MILGITGISGSGKHEAAEFFRKRNWVILDADKIAHHLYRPYTNVWKAIVKEFGEGILTTNDVIDRVKLGKIVFNSKDEAGAEDALKKLNAIVHPFLKRRINNDIHRHFRRKSNIVIVVALWRELNVDSRCDKLILIKADHDLRAKRMQQRDGISSETYEMRVKNQTEPDHPDFVVENSGTLDELRLKLNKIYQSLDLEKAAE